MFEAKEVNKRRNNDRGDIKMPDKIFTGMFVLNYKNGEVKMYKKQKTRYLPHEIPIKYKIKVSLPTPKVYQMNGEIVIPEEKVSEMVLEEI